VRVRNPKAKPYKKANRGLKLLVKATKVIKNKKKEIKPFKWESE
jgi:hypothetical protein